MDGVLVNMMQGVMDLYDAPLHHDGMKSWAHVDGWDQTANTLKDILGHEHLTEEDVWQRIADAGDRFWSDLEPFDDMHEILKFVEMVATEGSYICSTPTPIGGCASGKLAWIKEHLPRYYHRRYFLTPKKSLLAGPKRLLIDDSDHNIMAWREAGGLAIRMPMPWNIGKHRPQSGIMRDYLVEELFQQLR